jgi:hypothetical protein
MAAPRPVVTLTDTPPIMLHTKIYHNMLFFPYLTTIKKFSIVKKTEPESTDLGAK